MKNLFEGEIFSLQKKEISSVQETSDDLIDEKYIKGEIRIVTEQARYPLDSILSMVNSPNYILNPEFQRRHRWNIEKKSKLIESFIMNVPIPPIFLYETDFSVYEVMDGLQRITAISQYYNDQFALQGLEMWSELNGRKYSELPEQIKRGIDRRYLSSIILLKETAKTEQEAQYLKQLVFERINSGGVKLEAQEARNALYPGPLNSLTIELAQNSKFKKIFSIPNVNSRNDNSYNADLVENSLYSKMQDAELVLRFFAYRHIEELEGFTLEKFLDSFLQAGNKFPKSVLDNYRQLFTDTINLIYGIYKHKALWLYRQRGDHWIHSERPTKVLYDPLMIVFSRMLIHSEKLLKHKSKIVRETEALHKEYAEVLGGRNTGKSDVLKRVEILSTFYQKFIE